MFPVMILIDPQLGRNIGNTARAMLNCGLQELRLVRPPLNWLNENTRALSAGADIVLDNAQCFENVESATADLHRLYATTARHRDMVQEVMTPRHFAKTVTPLYQSGQRIGVLFGPEKCGLENDDLGRVKGVIKIPVNPEFSSFNLSQAVLILAYEIFLASSLNDSRESHLNHGNSDLAKKEEVDGFLDQLLDELDKAGYLRPEHKKSIMQRNLRNIFSRIDMTSQEVRTLRGVVSSLVNPNGIFSRPRRRPR